MEKPTIVQVTPYYPPHLGGMENCVMEVTKNLHTIKYPVMVYTSAIGKRMKHQSKQSFPIHYLWSFEFAHTPIMPSLFFHLLKVPKGSILHLHIAQAFTPEVVYLAAKIKQLPYIAHVHLDVAPSGFFGFLLLPYKKIILRHVLQQATKIICLTETQKQTLKHQYDLPEYKLCVIPNGVGKEYFLKRLNIKNDKVAHVLFVGRLVAQKNLPLLLEAAKQLGNKIQIDIVGKGELENDLKGLIIKYGLNNVRLHGPKFGKDLRAYYQKADLFILPSYKEGLSLALLEAMAAGLPVVAVSSEGMQNILGNGGILVKKPTANNLASALQKLVSDTQLRRQLSRNAKKIAEKYNWQTTTNHISQVYQEINI